MVKTLSMIRIPVRKTLLGFSFLVPLFLGTTACSVNPVSHRPELTLMTVEQERRIGSEEAVKVEQQMGLVDDPALIDYLNVLGQRLAKESPRQDVTHHFYLADMPEPNAFALPGGYVYVTRGLLALVTAEDELAGVVGHEIGHVAARSARRKPHRRRRQFRAEPRVLPLQPVSGVGGGYNRAGDGGQSRLGPGGTLRVSEYFGSGARALEQWAAPVQLLRFASGESRPGEGHRQTCDAA
jgi:predicted Zn-dependent protease